MRQKFIFCSIAILSIFNAYGQDSISSFMNYKNEFGAYQSYSNYFETALPYFSSNDLPDFFPTMEELNSMSRTEESYVTTSNSQFYYNRWFAPTQKNKQKRYGVGLIYGMNSGYYFTRDWSTKSRFTFDTVTAQSSGTKYPVDSVTQHFYESKTEINYYQVGIAAYKRNQIMERASIEFGLKAITNIRGRESTSFRYLVANSVQTYYSNYDLSKESATLISEERKQTKSDINCLTFSVPINFRYSFHYEPYRKIILKRNPNAKTGRLIFTVYGGIEPMISTLFINNVTYGKINVNISGGASIQF